MTAARVLNEPCLLLSPSRPIILFMPLLDVVVDVVFPDFRFLTRHTCTFYFFYQL